MAEQVFTFYLHVQHIRFGLLADMSGLSFVNDINRLLTMDEPVTKGPLPRWQKKNSDLSNTR